jgi:hypothetical protein
MSDAIRGRQWRMAAFSVVFGLLVVAGGATPALAASTPFSGTYPDEKTTFRNCPAGLPPHAICFTGVGHGLTSPPGSTATELYAGYIDPNTLLAGCPVDHNAVAISTSGGTLFLTTTGSGTLAAGCGSPDTGTWQAFGGTGIFEGATGSGTVATAILGGNADGSINSSSTYTGTLNLRGD